MGGLTSKVVWGAEDAPDLVVPFTLSPDATMPNYATTGSAGMDLHAAERVELHGSKPMLVDTGVSVALPFMLYGQIQGRSGLALHHGISVHPGVIDTDYRGSIKVLLVRNNVSADEPPFVVEKGDRIAQLLVLPIARPGLHLAEALPSTKRGEGGFGSTGVGVVVAQPASPPQPPPSPPPPLRESADQADKENIPLVCSPGERV